MSAEQELRDLVDERVHAVRERDSATLAARPAEDVITFDVLPPLNSRGSQATAEHLRAWLDGYDGPIDYSAHDVQVSAQGDLGFCSFLYHVGGTLKTGDEVNMWVPCHIVLPTHRRTLAHRARPRVGALRPRHRTGPDQSRAAVGRRASRAKP